MIQQEKYLVSPSGPLHLLSCSTSDGDNSITSILAYKTPTHSILPNELYIQINFFSLDLENSIQMFSS